jgi:hypothetical protein
MYATAMNLECVNIKFIEMRGMEVASHACGK